MRAFSASDLQQALGLKTRPAASVVGVSTDTRTLKPGDLFVALVGERFDGHDYLPTAREKGAIAAVVRRRTVPVPGLELLEVDDTLWAYGSLGTARRRRITGPVVCVTGNNGKTTTKEMVAAVLKTKYRTWATRANNNNLVGVPLTMLESPVDTEALVIEAGGNVPGELPRLGEICEPDAAVLTNATAGHLEGYGSIDVIVADTIAAAHRARLVVSGMEPPSLPCAARAAFPGAVTVGWSGADRTPEVLEIDALARPAVRLGGERVQLPLPGRHQAINALMAWTVGEWAGVEAVAARAALAAVSVPGGRSELRTVGALTILDDCYNANPHSFDAAIATAKALAQGRRLVFVAGTMRELGPDAPRLHREVAERLVALKPDLLALVGDFVPAVEPWAAQLGDRLLTAEDAPAMGPLLAERLQGDEVVVLKASRGAALERILPAITGRARN